MKIYHINMCFCPQSPRLTDAATHLNEKRRKPALLVPEQISSHIAAEDDIVRETQTKQYYARRMGREREGRVK